MSTKYAYFHQSPQYCIGYVAEILIAYTLTEKMRPKGGFAPSKCVYMLIHLESFREAKYYLVVLVSITTNSTFTSLNLPSAVTVANSGVGPTEIAISRNAHSVIFFIEEFAVNQLLYGAKKI